MTTYHLTVNGTPRSVEASDPDEPLLYILRNALGLKAAKFGCGLGQCGACTVMIEGEAVRSCQTPVSKVGGRAVTTQEGLGSAENPHKVQAAFIAEQAAQCGYCSNGMIMTSAAFVSASWPNLETLAMLLAYTLVSLLVGTKIFDGYRDTFPELV